MAGFFSFLENGNQSIGFFGDNAVTELIQNWFSANTEQTEHQVNLIQNPSSLSVNVYLPVHDTPFWLGITNTHTEYSAEAPTVATNQVADKIGYLASDNGNQIHWDASTGLLSFDRLPINTIGSLINQADSTEPLLTGYLEIDPLQFITQLDNKEYYAGKNVRLVDEYGNILYEASLPSIVFDDSLFAKQGFNLFAPILNVLAADTSTSNWLDNYLSKSQINSLLLPELFIGFNPNIIDNNIWSGNFDAPVSAFLSFTGIAPISEPSTLWLLFIGILLFRLGRETTYKAHRT